MGGKPRPPGDRSKIVGANVRAAREKAGLTQTELGDRIGCSQGQVMNLETARTQMWVERLLDLADALGVKPAKLLAGTQNVD